MEGKALHRKDLLNFGGFSMIEGEKLVSDF
jgi:hypothetical protein